MPARSVESSPVYGAPAPFGDGVNMRAALRTGDAKRAGQWYCAKHVPAVAGEGAV